MRQTHVEVFAPLDKCEQRIHIKAGNRSFKSASILVKFGWPYDIVYADSRNGSIFQECLLGIGALQLREPMNIGTSGIGWSASKRRRHECQELHALSISSHVHGFMIKANEYEFFVRGFH
jgi:hypothetical protein